MHDQDKLKKLIEILSGDEKVTDKMIDDILIQTGKLNESEVKAKHAEPEFELSDLGDKKFQV